MHYENEITTILRYSDEYKKCTEILLDCLLIVKRFFLFFYWIYNLPSIQKDNKQMLYQDEKNRRGYCP